MGDRARVGAPARRIFREPGSEVAVARASGVRQAECGGVGRAWLPTHGSPFEAVRNLIAAVSGVVQLHYGSANATYASPDLVPSLPPPAAITTYCLPRTA